MELIFEWQESRDHFGNLPSWAQGLGNAFSTRDPGKITDSQSENASGEDSQSETANKCNVIVSPRIYRKQQLIYSRFNSLKV